ncbi:unnamed protein product, partial [Staurois parvus]
MGPPGNRGSRGPVSLPKLKKAYEKAMKLLLSLTLLHLPLRPIYTYCVCNGKHLFTPYQRRTDNSWGPWAIGDHGAPVSLPKLKKAYEKGTRGTAWGPLLTPGPRAVPEFPNGQSAPA